MDYAIEFTLAILFLVVIYAQANGKSSNVVFLKVMTWLGIVIMRWLMYLYLERYYCGPASNILIAHDGGCDIRQVFAERYFNIPNRKSCPDNYKKERSRFGPECRSRKRFECKSQVRSRHARIGDDDD